MNESMIEADSLFFTSAGAVAGLFDTIAGPEYVTPHQCIFCMGGSPSYWWRVAQAITMQFWVPVCSTLLPMWGYDSWQPQRAPLLNDPKTKVGLMFCCVLSQWKNGANVSSVVSNYKCTHWWGRCNCLGCVQLGHTGCNTWSQLTTPANQFLTAKHVYAVSVYVFVFNCCNLYSTSQVYSLSGYFLI